MRLLAIIAAAALGTSFPASLMAQTDDNICFNPENIYAQREAERGENPFSHLLPADPFANCWWPVVRGNSTFHIRVTDHRTGSGLFFHNDGWRGTMPQEVWVLGLHANDASVRYRRSMSLYRFSCHGEVRRFALLKFTAFSASGEIIEDRETPNASWRIAIPDSKEQSLAGFACEN